MDLNILPAAQVGNVKNRKACLICRASKIKCLSSESGKCQRCEERRFICVYKEDKKRGRKTMYGEGSLTSNLISVPPVQDDNDLIMQSVNPEESDSTPITTIARFSCVPFELRPRPREFTSLATLLNGTSTLSSIGPKQTLSRKLPSVDVNDWDDPIKLGILTRGNVIDLFDSYFESLNPLIALLDPILHTPEWTLKTSIILYTAILTVSAKMFSPNLYQPLLLLVNRQLGTAFACGLSDISLVQSLSLLVFWKDARDSGAWRRIGYSIRLAYELGLDAAPVRPLPDEELEAREVLNRERTWIQLCCFDSAIFSQQFRPRMIPPSSIPSNILTWAIYDHPQYFCNSDYMLCASFTKENPFILLEATGKSPADLQIRQLVRNQAHETFLSWKIEWLGPITTHPRPLHPISLVIINFYDLVLSYFFSAFDTATLALSPEANNVERYQSFREQSRCAILVIDFVSSSAFGEDVLLFSQDVIFYGIVNCILFLVRNLNNMDSEFSNKVLTSLVSLIITCDSAARCSSDSPAYLSRFIQSVLESSNPNLPEIESPSNLSTTSEVEQEIILPLEQFGETGVLSFAEGYAEYSEWFESYDFVTGGNLDANTTESGL